MEAVKQRLLLQYSAETRFSGPLLSPYIICVKTEFLSKLLNGVRDVA